MERDSFKVIAKKKEEEKLEKEIKTYEIRVSEIHYMTYRVEAKNERDAKRIVADGSADYISDDYDNWEINDVEEVN